MKPTLKLYGSLRMAQQWRLAKESFTCKHVMLSRNVAATPAYLAFNTFNSRPNDLSSQ